MKKFLKVLGVIVGLLVLLCLSVVIGKNVVASKIKPETANTAKTANVVENKVNNETSTNTVEESTVAEKIDPSKAVIYEKSVKEINETYDPEYNYTFEDKIRLPFINIDSEYAERANNKLQEKYNIAANSLTRQDYGFYFTRMDYEEHIVGDKYASLSICEMPVNVPGGDFVEEFTLYNFDLQDGGKKLTKREIIEKFGITPNELEEKVKETLQKFYIEYEYSDEVYDSLEQFMSNSKYHFENLQVLITGENSLDVYLEYPIGPEGVRMGYVSIEV